MRSLSFRLLPVFMMVFLCLESSAQENMTNAKMQRLLRSNSSEIAGEYGRWEAYVANRTIYVITDSAANRMRIISPIVETKDLDDEVLTTLLKANFDRALDAKYSIFDGVVWSTFTHPLSELSDHQFVDAMHQVVNLVNNYGTTFSSTGLVFGGN